MLKTKKDYTKLSTFKQLRMEKDKAISRKLLLSGTFNY
jgi:hypothetical protein